LADIREAFAGQDEIRSAELVVRLAADPEKPWAECSRGKPISQKQLAGLLRPFGIASETIHPAGQPHAKGYRRVHFEDLWATYFPGQNASASHSGASEACKRANADGMGTSRIFSSVQEVVPHGSENGNLCYSHAGLHACTDENPETGPANDFDQRESVERGPERLGPPAISSGPDDDIGDVVL
jgi:hypothetical protein